MLTFALLLCALTCVWAQELVNTWANLLSKEFENLTADVMHVGDIKNLFENAKYTEQSIDSKTRFESLKKRLTDMFESKDTIVANLAEKVASAWTSASEDEGCTPLLADEDRISTKVSPELGNAEVDFDQSAVLIAPEAKPSNKEICFSRELDTVFKSNDPNQVLPWQYFGSQTGYHRQYPASVRGSGYDPRVRPWYTGASSGAKAVILILDTSGSMLDNNRMEIMKQAATAVLDSLTVSDFVNVVSFGSTAAGPTCAPKELLRATEANVNYLKDQVSKLRASGKTNFYDAFSVAFDMYESYQQEILDGEKDGACRDAFLFLTDGQPSNSQDHHELIQRRNKNNVHIFTYALGASATTQDDIACDNGGIYTKIADGGDLRTKMSSYYQLFSLTADDSETFWTAPYFDASGLGMMITGARIVFDPSEANPVALGVVGHDVRLTEFTQLVEAFNTEKSYAFLVDKRGNAIMHPRMSARVDSEASPVYEDIAVLENQQDNAKFLSLVRKAMLEGRDGSQQMVVSRLQDRGDSAYEGLREVSLTVNYIWASVGPFIFGYAQAEEDSKDVYLDPILPGSVPTSYYHALEYYEEDVLSDISPKRFGGSDAKYPNQYITFETTTFYIAPRAFGVGENPALRTLTPENKAEVKVIHDYVNKGTGNAGFSDRNADLIRMLSGMNEFWVGVEKVNPAIGWLYLGTADGIHRRYPGGDQKSKSYDPTLRPWYKRASTFAGRLAISTPYLDASGLGRVVTLAHTIPQRQAIGGVIGLDFTYDTFYEMIRTASPCRAGGADGVDCFLIDSSGYVVFHEDFVTKQGNTENEFINVIDEALAQTLVNAKFLVGDEYADFRTQQRCFSYNVDLKNAGFSGLSKSINNACGGGQAHVSVVQANGAATNLYAIVLSADWTSRACFEAKKPGCEKIVDTGPCEKAQETTQSFAASKTQCKVEKTLTDEDLEVIRIADPLGGTCHGPDTGMIAGIVVGVAILLCCCCLIIFVLYRRYSDD